MSRFIFAFSLFGCLLFGTPPAAVAQNAVNTGATMWVNTTQRIKSKIYENAHLSPHPILKVPPPAYQAPGAGDARMGGGGPVAININGGSHDPHALALLVQLRIDEQMNWRAHDTESEYT